MSIATRQPDVSLVDPDAEVIPVNDPGEALGAITRGEIDIQIATAKRWPRSIRTFMDTAREMCTLDEETAARCFYSLPRAGKAIEGPSVRLAEIAVSAWGHLRVASRIVAQSDKWITAQAVCWDMQTNVAVGIEVRRRITDSHGRTYKDDMIGVTANAACSIALRNAVFRVIPNNYITQLYNECRAVAIGDAKTLASKRAACVDAFAKMGVPPETIFKFLEIKGIEDVTLDHLGTLRGLFTAIKDGDTSIEDAFTPKPPSAAETVNTAITQPAKLPEKADAAPVAQPPVMEPVTVPTAEPAQKSSKRG